MPDVHDPFSHLDPEVPVPLAASEVRRRGDRLRRRNGALAVVGAVAAVAIVATPLALLSGGGGTTAQPATSTPSVTDTAPPPSETTTVTTEVGPAYLATVPDDFPLDDQLPETNDVDGSPVEITGRPAIARLEQCGTALWTPDGPAAATLSVAGVAFQGFEDTRRRTLALYASEDDAAAALRTIRDGLNDCHIDSTDGGGSEVVADEMTSVENESVFTFRYRTDGRFDTGLEVLQLHREGNALLLATYYGEGGSSPSTIASAIDTAAADSAGVYDAMADAFGGVGASQPDPDDENLTGFPLASGWPDGPVEGGGTGLSGPGYDVDGVGLDLSACDRTPREPAASPLSASWSNVEDTRVRLLIPFPDAAGAVSWVDDLRALNEGCLDEQDDDGFTFTRELRDTQVGGQSFAVATRSTYDGAATTSLHVLQIVRLGRGVLVDFVSNEGGASGDPASELPSQLATMDADAAEVVSAMCVFTEAGC